MKVEREKKREEGFDILKSFLANPRLGIFCPLLLSLH